MQSVFACVHQYTHTCLLLCCCRQISTLHDLEVFICERMNDELRQGRSQGGQQQRAAGPGATDGVRPMQQMREGGSLALEVLPQPQEALLGHLLRQQDHLMQQLELLKELQTSVQGWMLLLQCLSSPLMT
jgi:hypothetical protein